MTGASDPGRSGQDRVDELLLACLESRDGDPRAMLEQLCREHPRHGQALRRRFAAAERMGLLDQPPPDTAGRQIGEFRLVRELGRGGMGVVWLAVQKSLGRQVALKLIRSDCMTPTAVRRFRHEAAILGHLRHPGIAHVYEIGSAETVGDAGFTVQQPFIAMEYVCGEPLDAFAARRDLDVRARLELAAQVCDAVDYAHRSGVVHRDLKPGNVLVDEAGHAKILDFGVARATGGDLETMTMHTAVGQVVGTIPYMSPEQVAGDAHAADTRSDVYALGAILYQLMTGRVPLDIAGRSIPEAARLIREETPRPLGTVDTTLRGDIETIVGKALEKEPNRRYASAGDLAADVRRHLRDEPIVARPASRLYQLRKFARRHKEFVAAIVTGFVLLSIGLVAAIEFALRANAAADRERRRSYSASLAAAAAALDSYDPVAAERHLRDAPVELRGWEWHHLESRIDESVSAMSASPSEKILDAPSFGAGGETVSAWVFDGEPPRAELARWSSRTGQRLPASRSYDGVERIVTSAGGTTELWLAADDGELHVRFAGSESRIRPADSGMAPRGTLLPIAVSDDGRHVAVLDAVHYDGRSNRLSVIDLRTGAAKSREVGTSFGRVIAVVRDGGGIALAGDAGGRPGIWRVTDDEFVPFGDRAHRHTGAVRELAWSPDGGRVATASEDTTVRVWDAVTGAQLACLRGHRDAVVAVAFDPDGNRMASASEDGTLRLWDATTFAPVLVYLHRERRFHSLAFSADGTRLATVSGQRGELLHVWDATPDVHPRILSGHSSYVYPVTFDPAGDVLVSGGWDAEDDKIVFWDPAACRELGRCSVDEHYVATLSFSPTGRWLASLHPSRNVHLWDASSRRPLASRRFAGNPFEPLTFHATEPIVVEGVDAPRGEVLTLDLMTGERARAPLARLREFRGGMLSPDGAWLASVRFAPDGSFDVPGLRSTPATLRVFDARTGALRAECPAGRYDAFAFSPRAAGRIAAPLPPDRVAVWDARTGERIAELTGHSGEVIAVTFSPDGRRLVTGSRDQTIRVWDAATFDEIVTLRGHRSYVYALAFSPDGSRLVSKSGDGTVRIWDTRPLAETLHARR